MELSGVWDMPILFWEWAGEKGCLPLLSPCILSLPDKILKGGTDYLISNFDWGVSIHLNLVVPSMIHPNVLFSMI
jgi:hypothetical protein